MPHRKLIARLLSVVELSEQDQLRLGDMPRVIKTFGNGDPVARQGECRCTGAVVMDGFLSLRRVVSERNQISSVYVPGDMPDLHTLHLPVMDHDLCSEGASTVAFIPHSHLRRILRDSPGLTNAFWRETLIQGAIYREWVENLGSRAALPRVAHLFCELATRLEMVGLLDKDSFRLPVTQQDLADACGLSTVHINRTIQELRRMGLLEWRGHVVNVLRRRNLETVAEFNAGYLHALEVPSPTGITTAAERTRRRDLAAPVIEAAEPK
ncbi:Crp/Fnr family transcriptional regulator [Bradyrhizobium sp. Pear77]|uniref:Crp/Fnr family transcriptional regulator n=1 Tax=Bradyrhizobium altum TaxID=1571202 RepID=UPI0028978FEB|nr:Crp/Fnr family transcriptional regulator [Bradyrhizobium altum]MCC8955360.1 Crp/Fnr family transcriptional regulator [Bradyrhizobium altum]